VTVEVFWKAKSPIKKLLIFLIVKRAFKKGITTSLNNLAKFVKESSNSQGAVNS